MKRKKNAQKKPAPQRQGKPRRSIGAMMQSRRIVTKQTAY